MHLGPVGVGLQHFLCATRCCEVKVSFYEDSPAFNRSQAAQKTNWCTMRKPQRMCRLANDDGKMATLVMMEVKERRKLARGLCLGVLSSR